MYKSCSIDMMDDQSINQSMRRTWSIIRWEGRIDEIDETERRFSIEFNGNTGLSIDAWWIVGKDRRDRINLTGTLYAVQLHQVQKLKRLFWWDVGRGHFSCILDFRTFCLQISFLNLLWIFVSFCQKLDFKFQLGWILILTFIEAPTPIKLDIMINFSGDKNWLLLFPNIFPI